MLFGYAIPPYTGFSTRYIGTQIGTAKKNLPMKIFQLLTTVQNFRQTKVANVSSTAKGNPRFLTAATNNIIGSNGTNTENYEMGPTKEPKTEIKTQTQGICYFFNAFLAKLMLPLVLLFAFLPKSIGREREDFSG